MVNQSVEEGLESTLESLDIRSEAAAHIASMRAIARRMDIELDASTLAKLANTFGRQLVELRQWVAPPPIEEDPFDVLSRELSKGTKS